MEKLKNQQKSQEPGINLLFTFVKIYYLIITYPAKARHYTRRQKMAKNKQSRSQIYNLVILVPKKKKKNHKKNNNL